MATTGLLQENVWTERTKYYEAECEFYQQASKASLTPLAEEIAKARKRLIEVIAKEPETGVSSVDTGAVKFLEKKVLEISNLLNAMQLQVTKLDSRMSAMEERVGGKTPVCTKGLMVCPKMPTKGAPAPMEEDDDVDLFGSESEDDETANKVREERLAAYNEKKSKKVAIIAKSSVVLDIKPWEDTTNMKQMEEEVRAIKMDGLLWGAAKLVPLAYGIKKLQIGAVVEDDKVSIDELQERIEAIEELVQSMDIAAFNKI